MQRARLPHQERLEQAFGESLDGISAYTGAGATLAMIGARAAATPETVHFGDHAPDLHTAAHEVAHVLQYRHASGPAPAGIGAVDSPAEADAHQAADAVVRGQSASVSAAPAAEVQMLPFQGLLDRLRKPKYQPPTAWLDSDIETRLPSRGGSLNRVDPIVYNRPIDSKGTTLGYFKPTYPEHKQSLTPLTTAEQALENDDPYTDLLAKHAIVSTRLDKILGFNLLPEERLAQHTDPVSGQAVLGTVAPEVKGLPLYEHSFDQDMLMGDAHQREEVLKWVIGNQGQAKIGQDASGAITSVKALSATTYHDHNYSLPSIQRGLWDLQLLDSITGETDRHGGNIIIKDGTVRGIDNDRNLRSDDLRPNMKNNGPPALVDAGTAKRILKLPWQKVLQQLNAAMLAAGIKGMRSVEQGVTADGDEIGPLGDLLQTRLRRRYLAVQNHIRSLPPDCRIKRWNAQTYQRAISDTQRLNYTAVAVDYLQKKPQLSVPGQMETQAEYNRKQAAAAAAQNPTSTVTMAPPQIIPQSIGVAVPPVPTKVSPTVPARPGKSGWVQQRIAALNAPGH